MAQTGSKMVVVVLDGLLNKGDHGVGIGVAGLVLDLLVVGSWWRQHREKSAGMVAPFLFLERLGCLRMFAVSSESFCGNQRRLLRRQRRLGRILAFLH